MAPGRLIDGKAAATTVRARVAKRVSESTADGRRAPALATVLVGDEPASRVYVANKHRACEEVGIRSIHHELPADIGQSELEELVVSLGEDGEVDGILVQLPLPDGLDPDAVIDRIDPGKDVDGLTPTNAGLLASGRKGMVPCTPAGVIELLELESVNLVGSEAVVVGRSNLVGRPLVPLLLAKNATVTVCHSRTHDLAEVCRRADVLIAAAGSPGLVRGEMVKPGAVVIDVGINRTEGGLVGDVAFDETREVASAITPVPGGVGPMTIAMLLENTLSAAIARGDGRR